MDMNLNNNACKYNNVYNKGKDSDIQDSGHTLGIP
jgi:hypothetical protein